MFRILLVLFFSFLTFQASAQFYSLGEERIGIRWKVIKTPHYKVIYPVGKDSLAMRYAYLLEANRPRVVDSIGATPVRYPVVLHTETALSNGSVALTPHRMELFTIPAPDAYSQLWDRQLTIHESRHVAQMDAFYGGLFKYLYWFLGEQSPGLAASLLGNRMIFEGDAVVTETQFSNTGRGRDSEFLKFYRTAFIKGDKRNFHRWFFGSNMKYTPNRYATGYVFNTGARLYTGQQDVIQRILENFVRNWYYIFFYDVESYRRVVGINNHNILKYGQFNMTEIWQREYASAGRFSDYDTLTIPKKKLYTEYKNVIEKDSSYYALKKGMEHTQSLVKIRDGREEFLKQMSSSINKISRTRDTLYWTEYIPNVRWPNRYYSNIFTYNTETGKKKQLTRRGYYYYPFFDGSDVYAAQYNTDGTTAIVRLSEKNGNQLEKSADFSGVQFKEIIGLRDTLYFTAITEDGIGLYRTAKKDLGRLSLNQTVIAPVHARLEALTIADDVLYFESDRTTVGEIYALKSGRVMQLTHSEFGSSDPSISGDRLVYSKYDIDGDSPVSVPLDSCLWKTVDFSKLNRYEIAEMLTDQVKGMEEITEIDTSKFEVKKYSRFLNMFNFHSWTPFYYDMDAISSLSFDKISNVASLGATFQAQNLMNTSQITLGYSYRRGFHAGHLKWKYAGLYPVFEVSLDVNDRHSCSNLLVDSPKKVRRVENHSPFVNLNISAYIPFNLSSGGWTRGLIPQVTYLFTNDRYYSYTFHDRDYFYDGTMGQIETKPTPVRKRTGKVVSADVYGLNHSEELGYEYDFASRVLVGLRYYQVIPTPKSAIYPRWGFSVSGYWTRIPNRTGLFGDLAYFYAYGYLPGFTRQQGLKLSLSAQAQFVDKATYFQGNLFSQPRGYKPFTSAMYVGGSLDYAIPIYLGDTPLAWFAYLKRLQLIPFVDAGANYMNVRDFGKPALPGQLNDRLKLAVGTDVLLDATFLGIALPISIGFRYSYTLESPVNFQFLFSASLD